MHQGGDLYGKEFFFDDFVRYCANIWRVSEEAYINFFPLMLTSKFIYHTMQFPDIRMQSAYGFIAKYHYQTRKYEQDNSLVNSMRLGDAAGIALWSFRFVTNVISGSVLFNPSPNRPVEKIEITLFDESSTDEAMTEESSSDEYPIID